MPNPPYDRIYFDTNIFIAAHWPSPSPVFLSAIEVARTRFEVPTVLIEPVERELKNHWCEVMRAKRLDLQSQAGELSKLLSGVDHSWTLRVPSHENIESLFLRQHNKAVKQCKLLRAAPPLRQTTELFDMALRKARPFKDQGKGFQDAVIALAVLDDLDAAMTSEAAFVSNDGGFDEAVLNELCLPSCATLHFFKDIRGLHEDLNRYVTKSTKETMDLVEGIARQNVEQALPEIQSYLDENLQIPLTFGGFLTRRHVERFDSIEVIGIRSVFAPIDYLDVSENVARISAYLDVRIHITVRSLQAGEATSEPSLKVGQTKGPPALRPISYVNRSEAVGRVVLVDLERYFDSTGLARVRPIAASSSAPPSDPGIAAAIGSALR